jgi:hypothetical protein
LAYANRQPSIVTFQPSVYQPSVYQPAQPTVNPWPCPKCTFVNSGSTMCEMCGLVRDHASQSATGSGLTTYDVAVRGSRPVAGLPDYNTRTGFPVYGNRTTLQNSSEPWMHLPNSGLETDQPMPPPSSL